MWYFLSVSKQIQGLYAYVKTATEIKMGFSTRGKFDILRSIVFSMLITLITVTVEGARKRTWEGSLVFEDDFDGEVLNSKWEKVGNCEGKGDKDKNLECFTVRKDNVRVRNGVLIIEAKPEDYLPEVLWAQPKNYTSGRVKMTNDMGFRHGTFIVRARLAKGTHLLSSIYLMPAYQDHDNCKYEEIDVVQGRGQRTSTVVVGALYGRRWNHASVKRTEKVLRRKDLSEDFHEFAVVWKKYRMEWFVDGELIYSVPMYYYSDWLLQDESNLPCNYNKQLFQDKLQFNFGLSVGGSMFPEAGFGSLVYEQARNWSKPTMEIDWVKVYQI